jgi:hypothetical protein
MFKILLVLAHTHPNLASWNNAIRYLECFAKESKEKGTHSDFWKARGRFLSVAHLWGAWSFRERRILDAKDFQTFLAQAENLREWGQTWRSRRAKSEPLLPSDVWRVPTGYHRRGAHLGLAKQRRLSVFSALFLRGGLLFDQISNANLDLPPNVIGFSFA